MSNYKEYLNSNEWKILRRKAYQRANHTCEFCSKPAAHVHHIKYPKHFKDDKLENLVVVCEKCHALNHGIRKKLNIYLAGKVGDNQIKWKAVEKINHVANFYSSDGTNHSQHLWGCSDWTFEGYDDDDLKVKEYIIDKVPETDLLVAILDKELSCGSIAEIAWFAAFGVPCQIYLKVKQHTKPTKEESYTLTKEFNKVYDCYWLVSKFPRVNTKVVKNTKEIQDDLLIVISKRSNE